MQFVQKHLFVLLLMLVLTGFLTLQFWPNSADNTRDHEHGTPPNLSILVTRLPATDLLHLFAQNLDPVNGSLISQEVFTLERVGNGATIAHYTSSSPHFMSPAAVAHKRADGTVLSSAQQSELQAWMRGQFEARLRQLDTALQRRTTVGVFVALRMVHEGKEKHLDKANKIRPWVILPAKHAAPNDPASQATPLDLQLQLSLDATAYENLETFAKRLADEFQQRTPSAK